jgi:hypothetical protein
VDGDSHGTLTFKHMEKPYMVKSTIEYSDGTETITSYLPNGDKEVIENRVAEDIAIGEAKDRGEILEPVKKTRKTAVKKTVKK